jgi:ABC-type phosphate transport system substrate-binding protein
MKNYKITILLFLLGTSFLMSFTPPPAKPKIEIAIIINAANPIAKLGTDFVKNFWLRRFVKRWKEINKNIAPVDRKNKCAEQEVFYNAVLGLPANAVEAYLSARQYQNGDSPIQKFATDADIISYVGREPGAIGYVNAASVSENDKDVKIILIVTK